MFLLLLLREALLPFFPRMRGICSSSSSRSNMIITILIYISIIILIYIYIIIKVSIGFYFGYRSVLLGFCLGFIWVFVPYFPYGRNKMSYPPH